MYPALVLAALSLAQPPAVPNPDWVCRVVLAHKTAAVNAAVAKGVSRKDAEHEVAHWYYLAWQGWPAERVAKDKRALNWWVNNLHFAADAIDLSDVPGSGGVVQFFDRRQPGWSAEAVSAVFNRDVVFRQPATAEDVAALLRESVGRAVNKATLHVEAVAWAPRFFRDTLESQRNPSYYDLLFSAQRFRPAAKGTGFVPDPNYKPHPDARQYPGWYTNDGGKSWTRTVPRVEADRAVEFVDFPQTLDDWEGLFKRKSGATATAYGRPVLLANLAVVAGHRDDPAKGSIVSVAGRAVEIEQGDFGPVMKTLDVKEQVGERNLVEFAPRLARGERPEVDAFETLAALPAGAQAKSLWNGKRKRVELADGNIARGVQKPVNPANVNAQHSNVLNGFHCDRCHAPSFGVIEPRDLVKDFIDAGVDFKVYDRPFDPAEVIQFRAAYGRLREAIPGYQARHKSLIERTTKGPDGKPWAPRDLVDAIEGFVHTYDSPVTKDAAAAELGVPAAVLAKLSGDTLTLTEKGLVAAKSIPCPRPAFDADVRPRLVNLLVTEFKGEVYKKP